MSSHFSVLLDSAPWFEWKIALVTGVCVAGQWEELSRFDKKTDNCALIKKNEITLMGSHLFHNLICKSGQVFPVVR